ncbi:MAG: glycosyltransferase family 4 protein [Planctomycetota bacterium]|nr:glycosyltransferase family 4 protein [Planctomycetota bacterium]
MASLAVVTNLPNPYRVPLFNLLSERAAEAGWRLEVVFGSRTNRRRQWKLDDRAFRFPHRYLEAPNVDLAPDRVVNTYRGIGKALGEIAPDAIVTTGFSLGSVTVMRFAQRRSIPWAIWSGAVSGREPGWLRRRQRRWLVRRADAFLAYGSAARDYLVELGAQPERVRCAWNTVDTSRFLALPGARTPAPGEPLRLLSVGYLEYGKRIDLLLDTIARADEPVVLDIVGDGSERVGLEAHARKLGLGDAVRFHGYKANTELGPYYANAHAFAFPTQYDVWGLALLEAMAAGLPALASPRAGATRDLVVEGETGFAVEFTDPAHAAESLSRLRSTGIAEMGKAARNRIERHFTLERSADAWQELLSEW